MEKTVFTDNGVAVHGYQNKNIGSFAISLFIRAGTMYEGADENGFTHFFEHVVFRNINACMDGKLYETLDLCGLYFNAATYVNYIEFTISGSKRHFKKAAEIICHVLSPLKIKADGILPEKKRIKAEIRENDEAGRHFFDSIAYEGSPLERSITGKCPDIDRYGIRKLRTAIKKLMTKENMFFYVGGNFDDKGIDHLISEIEKHTVFSGDRLENIAPLPTDFAKRDCRIAVKNAQTTTVKLSFDISSEGHTVSELFCLGDALFAGESCPMYRELSENTGLIYSYDDSVVCYGNFSVLSVTYEVRADKLIKSLDAVLHILADAKKNLGKRLPYILPAYTDNIYTSLDDAESIASDFGYYNHILGCSYADIEARRREFENVSPDAITRLAHETFNPERTVIAIKGNKDKIDAEKIRKMCFDILR